MTDYRIGIDVVTNRVVAAVPAAQREAIEEAGVPAGVTLIDAQAVSVEPDACTSRSLCDTTLRAGTRLWRAAAGFGVGEIEAAVDHERRRRAGERGGEVGGGDERGVGGGHGVPVAGVRVTGAARAPG